MMSEFGAVSIEYTGRLQFFAPRTVIVTIKGSLFELCFFLLPQQFSGYVFCPSKSVVNNLPIKCTEKI